MAGSSSPRPASARARVVARAQGGERPAQGQALRLVGERPRRRRQRAPGGDPLPRRVLALVAGPVTAVGPDGRVGDRQEEPGLAARVPLAAEGEAVLARPQPRDDGRRRQLRLLAHHPSPRPR